MDSHDLYDLLTTSHTWASVGHVHLQLRAKFQEITGINFQRNPVVDFRLTWKQIPGLILQVSCKLVLLHKPISCLGTSVLFIMDFYRPHRVSMSLRPALHLLSSQLRIASIAKSHLPTLTYPLLQLTLKLLGGQPSCRR